MDVVLVRPETPSNIGAVARAIRNTGLAELRLVGPGDWRTVDCWRTAWGAHEVLEQARVLDSIPAAVAGAEYVVALSGRREAGVPVMDVREAAAEIAALAEGARAAVVFGTEATGLDRDELSFCGRRAFIPSHPAQPSYNLSHAVALVGYEILRQGRRSADPPPRRAEHGEKAAMTALLREGLAAIRALPEKNADIFFRDWQALFHRADLTPKEVALLEHLARKMIQAGRKTET